MPNVVTTETQKSSREKEWYLYYQLCFLQIILALYVNKVLIYNPGYKSRCPECESDSISRSCYPTQEPNKSN